MPALPADRKRVAWTSADSEELYGLPAWGAPYFSADAGGHVLVSPQGGGGASLDLYDLVTSLRQRDVELPLLLRFPDILADRIGQLYSCFERAIARYGYDGSYRGVYPLKCNQQRHLVEAIVAAGRPYCLGLEAGSKPELALALAVLEAHGDPSGTDGLLICNGYKDRDYIAMALLASRLGQTPVVVVEQLEELAIALELSHEFNLEPLLGVRAKLSAAGSGRWSASTGDRAKFGLSAPQLLAAVEQLRASGQLQCLQLLHFHIGSQIAAIGTIKAAIREAAQLYVALVQLGANLHYLDVGGGLAVDYDGSKTHSDASKNYSLQNYANDIAAEVKEACDRAGVALPTLISESGRAIAAHHAVLIANVLGINTPPELQPSAEIALSRSDSSSSDSSPAESEHALVRELRDTYAAIAPDNLQESYHDAVQFKDEAASLFDFGYLSLRDRARVERLYWACCRQIRDCLRTLPSVPDDLSHLEATLAATYYVNLSVFRSLPDSWALQQLFPILPIHRLDTEPSERATLADLTCDSDGRLDRFPSTSGHSKPFLELHPPVAGEPYYLGVFLVGAYQEILGSAHNLFGDANVAHVRVRPDGYQIEHLIRGDTATEILARVHYDAEDLVEALRRRTECAIASQQIALPDAQRLLRTYERGLRNYTYLEQ
ncbi:arginine decarboxylase (spermidine biosynthesis) [Rubidibacter lacunae KORDI 51-2]|uniref:Biosynthetic arginine decarboxylase n=1 Tax=Rubidibacter lacunae KORDI 51-2 TaxID=582515 RepID=U5D8M3_9CHRO|nr:biosynthetic arginine decarboxylase [Rubidibacter lacunae]ERN40958.1 arginine decarboxylase (spermidine biosynthesis) [Rubidibacter lacunae KORDI 51-2]